MQNFQLLSAVGEVDRPVLLKRGLAATIDELLMAAEYIVKEGNEQVILCERGIRTFETATRNTLDISAVPILKQRSHLPVVVDPSHAAGKVDLVEPLSLAAIAAGADGLMIEMHPTPETALSDGAQSLDPAQFAARRRPHPGRSSRGPARRWARARCRRHRTHSGVHRLAVIGVGMMGGSLALAAQQPRRRRRGGGLRQPTRPRSSRGLAARASSPRRPSSAAEAAAYADLVVVSTPVRSIPALVEECAAAEPRPRLITDMGSTKSAIMAALSPLARSLFIGGHPMCGAADSGRALRAGRPVRRATYFLCTTGAAFPKLYEMLQQFVLDLGARPTHIDAVAHDRIMAVISHLPHVLANVLMEHAGELSACGGKRALQCVGPSFKDLTRVAGANPPMWRDIFLENREALSESLRSVAAELAGVLRSLSRQRDEAGIAGLHRLGRRLPRGDAGVRGHHARAPCTRSRCACPTSPASISQVMTALGEAEHQRRRPHPSPHEPQRGRRPGAVRRRRETVAETAATCSTGSAIRPGSASSGTAVSE